MHRALSPFQNTSTCSVFHLHFQLGKGTWLISKGPRQVVVKEGVRLNRKLSPPTHTHTGCPETELSPTSCLSVSTVISTSANTNNIFFVSGVHQRQVPPAKMAERGMSVCAHRSGQSWELQGARCVCVCVC